MDNSGPTLSSRTSLVRILVGAMGDSSRPVQEAAASALCENARQNAGAILDCCSTSLQGGKRVASQRAGLLIIMAYTVREMSEEHIDAAIMRKIAKLAVNEFSSNKELNLDWNQAALGLLVSIGSRLPDVLMDEVFNQLAGSAVPVIALVETLTEFSSSYGFALEALQFAPRLKNVLSRVLPILGGVRENQRKTFANAFNSWCEAIYDFHEDCSSDSSPGGDMQALLHSAFELFLNSWVVSRDGKVRLATAEALGRMVTLISKAQLRSALPRLLPALLAVYKKEKVDPVPASQSLQMVLATILVNDGGSPMVEFLALAPALNMLLPKAYFAANWRSNTDLSSHLKGISLWSTVEGVHVLQKFHSVKVSDVSTRLYLAFYRRVDYLTWTAGVAPSILQNLNEVLRCFLTIGTVYPEEICTYLLQQLGTREDAFQLGTLSVFKHLLTRFSEPWFSRRGDIAEAVKSLLEERDLKTRKAIAELVVPMASSGYLEKETSEAFIEFLVQQCAISEAESKPIQGHHSATKDVKATELADLAIDKVKEGFGTPLELRAVCEKGLLLLSGTVSGAEVVLWPFLLKMLIPVHYTAAVAMVCKCISELLRRRFARGDAVSVDYTTSSNVPQPEELLARLLVLLLDPLAREQLVLRVLIVLNHLRPIFPTSVALLLEVEIPKLEAYIKKIGDPEGDSWEQSTWEDMIIHLLSELLDVIHDPEWIVSFGDALADHYDLYVGLNRYSALLHRCMGTVLRKIDDRAYVKQTIALMFRRADVSDETNRLGLAKAMGLVASAHLDTVLEKLRRVLESQTRKGLRRVLAFTTEQRNSSEVDNVCATLALCVGYAASYAPSNAIEARIDTLVVELEHLRCSCFAVAVPLAPRMSCGCSLNQGTNMLTGLLKVRTATAKQAVIAAINLLGQAVIKAANNAIFFPLKRRDTMLDFVMALMAGQDTNSLDVKLLHTQELALNACTTLVAVKPRLTIGTRDRILQATLCFFTLPSSAAVTDALFSNLTTLLCAILLTSGDDGKCRADQLQHLLKSLDQYVSSSVEYQRERASYTVLALLHQFRALCTAGSCPFQCRGNCMHLRTLDRGQSSSTGAAKPLLPPREALKLGERTMVYMPRCADVSPAVRKVTVQVIDNFFTMSLLLPEAVGSENSEDRKASCAALSALKDLIAATNWEAAGAEVDILRGIVYSVGVLLSTTELVTALRGCRVAICDKVLQSGRGAIAAITQLTVMRGSHLRDADVSRITQALFTAGAAACDRLQEVLAAMCCLAEHSLARVVFDEVLAATVTEIIMKDGAKRKGWPVQEAFLTVSHHQALAPLFLEHMVGILDQVHVYGDDEVDKGESSERSPLPNSTKELPQAATLALGAIFRGANDVTKRAVDLRYPRVLCSLLLHIGSVHGTFILDMQPLRDIVPTIQSFSECVGDQEMGKVLCTDGEQRLSGERWTEAVEEIASCSARSRPEEVDDTCSLLWPALKKSQKFHRAAAAAALSRLVQHSQDADVLLGHLIGALSAHVGDESATVRRLCVRSLVQIPQQELAKYASQVLGVIVAVIEDTEEEVAYAAVCGLSTVLEVVTEEIVAPMLLSLCEQLRPLQARQKENIRGASFEALGTLSRFAMGVQHEAFMEQVHTTLIRLVLHVNDEAPSVCLACKNTLRKLSPLLHAQDLRALANLRTFDFGRRLEYDEFVKEFVKHLLLQFRDRADTYVTTTIQAFESSWPLIQANSAYLAGCLLSEISDQKILAIYIPQVSSALIRMTANSPSAIVRAKSTLALSLLLNKL